MRLTLTEAAEEIKRLRRLERQFNAQSKQQEEEARGFLEQITTLKQQLLDSERTRKEEKASMMSTYENDMKKLKGQLKVGAPSTKVTLPFRCRAFGGPWRLRCTTWEILSRALSDAARQPGIASNNG